jgi:hypothetical protein
MKKSTLTTKVTETTEPKGNEITNTINSNSPLSDSQWVQWLNPFVI